MLSGHSTTKEDFSRYLPHCASPTELYIMGGQALVLPRGFLVLNPYKVLNKCLLNNCIRIKFRKVFYKRGLLSMDTVHDKEKTTWQEETFDSAPRLSNNISG